MLDSGRGRLIAAARPVMFSGVQVADHQMLQKGQLSVKEVLDPGNHRDRELSLIHI